MGHFNDPLHFCFPLQESDYWSSLHYSFEDNIGRKSSICQKRKNLIVYVLNTHICFLTVPAATYLKKIFLFFHMQQFNTAFFAALRKPQRSNLSSPTSRMFNLVF